MLPPLIALAGPLSGTALTLDQPEISVGRDAANEVAIVDPSISPRHCVFVCRNGCVTIRDLDHGNPTFVNGLPSDGRTLEDGDEIQIGGSLFVLRLSEIEAVATDLVAVRED